MKRIITPVLSFVLSFITAQSFAQTSSELIFKNPVLVTAPGTNKLVGATYRFYNVVNGTDALLTIADASQTGQLVNNIDVTEHGWDKAFQPEIGKSGNVSANQEWWVRFNLKFVYPNSTTKKKLDKFYATAIDVDGDNYVIQEWVQMYKPDSMKYRSTTLLNDRACVNAGMNPDSKTKNSQGPVQNYTNIDTVGTPVMVTYTFMNTDEINFVYGAKVGNGISNAGLRLNSLWFRSFNLQANSTLPIRNSDFIVTYDKKNVNLQWKTTAEDYINSFIIEKSADAVNYTEAGRIAASDNIVNYTYTDANVISSTGVLYYRIRYTEKTGEAKYSSIKVVRLSKETGASLTVYPNPVQNRANLTLPFAWQNKPVTVSVYNASGVQVQALSIKAASQTEALDFQHLSRGIYVVKAQCEGVQAEQRILRN